MGEDSSGSLSRQAGSMIRGMAQGRLFLECGGAATAFVMRTKSGGCATALQEQTGGAL